MTRQLTREEIKYGTSLIVTFMGYRYISINGTQYLQSRQTAKVGLIKSSWTTISMRGVEPFYDSISWLKLIVKEARRKAPRKNVNTMSRDERRAYLLFRLPILTPNRVIFADIVRFIEWYNEDIQREIQETINAQEMEDISDAPTS